MATVKQLTKQIETSKKRISDYERKIAMYRERRDKNIAAANKKYGLDIKAEDIISTQRGRWIDCSLPEAIEEKIGYDTSYKIINSHEYMTANIKDINWEIANLEHIKAKLSDLEAKAKAEAKKQTGSVCYIYENFPYGRHSKIACKAPASGVTPA